MLWNDWGLACLAELFSQQPLKITALIPKKSLSFEHVKCLTATKAVLLRDVFGIDYLLLLSEKVNFYVKFFLDVLHLSIVWHTPKTIARTPRSSNVAFVVIERNKPPLYGTSAYKMDYNSQCSFLSALHDL